MALGSGALTGLRSARFTPRDTPREPTTRGTKPPPMPAPPATAQGGGAAGAAAAAADGAAEDEEGGPGCGDFCVFAFRGPALPRSDGGGGGGGGSGAGSGEGGGGGGAASADAPTLALPLQRTFFAQCELIGLPTSAAEHGRPGGGGAACWPAGSTPPDHLRYFCFPTSVVERLCSGVRDAYGFAFSFTAQASGRQLHRSRPTSPDLR